MSTDRFDLLRKSSYKSSDLLIDIDRFDNGQDIIRISSKYRDVGSYYYEGLLLNVSGMDERLPIDTVYKEQGDALITLANTRLMCQTPAEPMPKISDLLAEGLVGAKVTIRQFYEGCTWTDVDDESAFTGWIKNEQTQYDESELVFTVSPHGKKHPQLPPYRMHEDDYSTMDTEGEGLIMPVVLGELNNDGKPSHNALVDMDAAYGGALLLDVRYIKYDTGDYWLLVAGHECNDILRAYKDLTATTIYLTEHNDACGGPNWRIICTAEIDSYFWDASKEWSCDVKGLEHSGAVIRDPIRVTREVLVQLYGMDWTGNEPFEIDNTSAGLNFDTYLWSSGLYCDGVINKEMSLPQFFTKMMGQFPFHIYRGRNGKIYFKKWERRPSVDYTEKKLSYKDEIFDLKIGYSKPKGPNISMLFWPNNGRSLADDVCQDGYFQRAFIQCTIQDSGFTLDGDINDSTLAWDITGSGIAAETKDLVICGREICEVNSYFAGRINVERRGGNGTTALSHNSGDRIYYARVDSSNGRNPHDQMGNTAIYCQKIEIWEDAVHTAVIDILLHGGSFADAERLADKLAEKCNASVDLTGTYACEWDAETNFYRLYTTDDTEFKILIDQSDKLIKVMGWWADTTMGTEHYGDLPARKRECQAAYDTVIYRNHGGWELKADWIVGSGLVENVGGTFCGDLTPLTVRDYRYDISHRPMKRVSLSAPNRFYNLLIGKIFEFDTDINDYLKVHGQNFTDLNWRVINARRVDMNTLRFIAEEAT